MPALRHHAAVTDAGGRQHMDAQPGPLLGPQQPAALVLLPWAVPVFGRLHPRSAARLIAAGALGLIGYNLPVTALAPLPGGRADGDGMTSWGRPAR